MKYALVNGRRKAPSKGTIGECPYCGAKMVAKCGSIMIHHWAHGSKKNCDRWWENETAWHRAWKNKFPREWQEIIHFSKDGEKHIADIKTNTGWAIEFQYSYLKPEERKARNDFYPKLTWVVNGLRRARDKNQLQRALENASSIYEKPLIKMIDDPGEYKLLGEWCNNQAPVFFDFGETYLWCLLPSNSIRRAHLMQISRASFIKNMKDGFDKTASILFSIGLKEYTKKAARPRSNPLPEFEKYLIRKKKQRRF